MPHHRNADAAEALDQFTILSAAFELDRFGLPFFDKPSGVAHGLIEIGLIRHKRQIADHHRTTTRRYDAARHRLTVIDHVIHRRGRCFLALDDHPERISDEENVRPGLIAETEQAKVIRREHGNSFALLLHFAQFEMRNLARRALCTDMWPPCRLGPAMKIKRQTWVMQGNSLWIPHSHGPQQGEAAKDAFVLRSGACRS